MQPVVKLDTENTFLKSFCFGNTRNADWTHNTHVYDVIVFGKGHMQSLHWHNNVVIFRNVHFKTRFQKFAFSVAQNAVVVWINIQNTHKRCGLDSDSSWHVEFSAQP